MTLVSKQRAILFADVTDSTAIYELLGDVSAAKAIDGCLQLLAQVVARWNGVLVKTIGDEIMVAFESAAEACEAAKAMQDAVNALAPTQNVKFAIRIGFHFGHVLENNMDFLGDAVNTASRLAGLARSRQILTSEATVTQLPPPLRQATRDLDQLNIKGKQDALRVFEVIWEEDIDSTQMVVPVRNAEKTRLILTHQSTRIEWSPEKMAIWIGRGANCELVVPEQTASRRHARIERRYAQYMLIDESTNGTYVSIDRDREVLIRREQLLLRSSGYICLGTPAAKATNAIHFACL